MRALGGKQHSEVSTTVNVSQGSKASSHASRVTEWFI